MRYASVTEVVRRIKDDVHGDYRLQSVAMAGNVIGLKRAANGHYYMNIREDQCSLRAIVFRNRVTPAVRALREGDHVVVLGAVNVYEKGGTLSFIIEQLFNQGTGSLQLQYEHIKNELLRKGYFATEHKQSLPRFSWRVGVVTSKAGAVLHDIQKIASERNPYAQILLYPVPVQGVGAEQAIAAAVTAMGRRKDLDVLIVGRGGGSLEDLWCFNSPLVVKAIYAAKVPVITAIGHETDTTLADYAADVRAATPTHAAELAFTDLAETKLALADLVQTAETCLKNKLESQQQRLLTLSQRLQAGHWESRLSLAETRLSKLQAGINNNFQLRLTEKEGRIAALLAKLDGQNPAALLRRGYGQLSQNRHLITSVTEVDEETPLQIQLADGTLVVAVREVKKRGKDNG